MAQEPIEGSIRIVGGAAQRPVMLSINDQPASALVDNRFEISLDHAETYRLKFSGDDIFTSVQTFSALELAQGPIPTIDLVARTPGRVELIFGGDVMAGRRYVEPIWGERQLVHDETRLADMKALLAPMKPYFESADLASLNLETVLKVEEQGAAAPKSVTFFTHPDLVEALIWMGIDHVSLGNNHVYDYLEPGLESTMAALDGSGMAHSGAGRDHDRAIAPSQFDLGGTQLSLLGAVGWAGTVQPNQIAEASKGGAALGEEETLRQAVRIAKDQGRAAIIQYHGNREYSDGPTDISETRLYGAVEEGAPLIIGHHPHVAHGVEVKDGSLIAWSLGNFLFDQYFMETHRAMALRVWLDDGQFYRGEVIPLHILDYRPVPATDGQRRALLDRVARLSSQRGTDLGLSGGHLIVGADIGQPFAPAGSDANLFARGDFETVQLGTEVDRSWIVEGGSARLVGEPAQGRALELTAEAGQCAISWTTTTFFRSALPGSYRVAFDMQGIEGRLPTLLVQQRPAGVGRFEALESAEWWEFLAQASRVQGTYNVAFDFNLDGEPGRNQPFRIKLLFDDACDGVMIDNLAIERVEPIDTIAD